MVSKHEQEKVESVITQGEQSYQKQKSEFVTESGIPIEPLYTNKNIEESGSTKVIGSPGQYPYTRGIYPTMYRTRTWTNRFLIGQSSPEIFNERQKAMIETGQTGISVIPCCNTCMRGYDSDEIPKETVGRCGSTMDSLVDIEIAFDGISLDKVSTAFNDGNPNVGPALYCALAKKQGIPLDKITGTSNQSDSMSHWIALHQLILLPLEAHMRCLIDHVKFCTKYMPKYHPLSIIGQHMAEQGATPVQELGFSLSSGIDYVKKLIDSGLDVDDFGPRLSFFFSVQSDFFENVAKIRAARRIWARIMRERFGAKNPASWQFKLHCQTTGVALTRQQPLNNIARTTLHALSAVLGGTQSLHIDSFDEPLWTPTPEAQRIAISISNIIAEETRVAGVVDPLGGSYYVESLTNEVEDRACDLIDKIDDMGGMFEAIQNGFPQREIMQSAVERQERVDNGEEVVVGVNKYVIPAEEETEPAQVKVNEELIDRQIERTKKIRRTRNQQKAKEVLNKIHSAAKTGTGNIYELLIEGGLANLTRGEMIGELRDVYGFGRPPSFL